MNRPPRPLTSEIAAAFVLAVLALTGCATNSDKVGATPPPAQDRIDQVSLMSSPVATSWTGRSQPDGVEIALYAFRNDRKLPVTLDGTVRFTMYDGVVTGQALANARPFQTWQFDAVQLRDLSMRSAFGWGYGFRLGWDRPPTNSSVTLMAEFRPALGPAVRADPVVVAVVLH